MWINALRYLHNPPRLRSGRFMQKPFRTQPALFVSAAELDRPALRALDDAEPLPALFRGLLPGVRYGLSDVRLSQCLSRLAKHDL